jgi:hypothetical protein
VHDRLTFAAENRAEKIRQETRLLVRRPLRRRKQTISLA